jgi:SAM-dependent methyltransferase
MKTNYWNNRFLQQGMIWGKEPSPTVFDAIHLFKQHQVRSVLVPGSGYGRNTKAFSSLFKVEGIELSQEAVELAKAWDPDSSFTVGSALHNLPMRQYDAIYCYDLLHLFLADERRQLVQQCKNALRSKGIMYVTCFSDEDSHNGIGNFIEENTYAYMPDKFAHFFTEQDLFAHFPEFEILESGAFEEKLHYQDASFKIYKLRFAAMRLMS